MPRPTPTLIDALRRSADRLRSGADYEWGHVGRCNCGHLVQSVCDLSDREIYRQFGMDVSEWSEQASEQCELTGIPLDDLFGALHQVGFGREDVRQLEWLDGPEVLERLPLERRHLRRNSREDVVLYMDTLAELLEEQAVGAS